MLGIAVDIAGQDINSILNAGDVPNLFVADDKEKVIADCREYNSQLGRAATRDTIYNTFVDCVRENLHIGQLQTD